MGCVFSRPSLFRRRADGDGPTSGVRLLTARPVTQDASEADGLSNTPYTSLSDPFLKLSNADNQNRTGGHHDQAQKACRYTDERKSAIRAEFPVSISRSKSAPISLPQCRSEHQLWECGVLGGEV